MQTFRAIAKKISPTSRSLTHCRRFSAHANNAQEDDVQNQVLVEGRASSRTAILNRPSSLNALNRTVAIRLKKLYEAWEENPDIGFVVMKGGGGRAFCAGGDLIRIYRSFNEEKMEECKEFFNKLYQFIYILGTYLKPHVAILDGFTLGGGGGVSIPGMFRVATEKTVFGTPETLIGFHPDAGASFYLSHLPGYLGEYLALTGENLNGVEMLASGLATHYALSSRLGWIEERLGTLITDDPSVIETSLEQYGDLVYPDKKSILHRISLVDKCFGKDTVEEIIEALEIEEAQSSDGWCTAALKKLKEASPLSLNITLRSIREGRYQSLDQCLIREYRMTLHTLSKEVSNDFCEGIRARMVDKDYAPKWDPPTLEHVSKDMVDHFFSPLDEYEPELELPTKLREAFI